MKPWSVNVSLEREGLATVPVWIKLPGLRLHLWDPQMLSKIASVCREPLHSQI